MLPKQAAAISVAVRILQAVATQTFFQPDEYFQSLEVAHRAVFGYGHLTWEWSVAKPIRSILFPSLWIPVYWFLKFTGLHATPALIWGPKVLQGLFASITDIALCRLTRQLFGPSAVPIALSVSLCSFFHGLALIRSLSNSLETSLTILAISYWPLQSTSNVSFRQLVQPLAIAALTCAIRPTSAVVWVYLCGQLLATESTRRTAGFNLLKAVALTGCAAATLLVFADSVYFGTLTFTPLNFLRINMSPVALFYGGNPWHYYLTQALPILLTSSLPLFLHGAYLVLAMDGGKVANVNALRKLLGLIVWTIAIYSLAGHKEWRFIHPMLPVMHIFCVLSLLSSIRREPRTSSAKDKSSPFAPIRKPWGFLLLLQLPAIAYVTIAHGRAQIAAMSYLRSIPEENLDSVGFLMPCHSTPWMAYLHRADLDKGYVWGLGCEPPLGLTNSSTYLDQTSAFYLSPTEYFSNFFPPTVDPSFPPSPNPTTMPGSSISYHTSPDSIYARSGIIFMGKWKHTWPRRLVMFSVLPSYQEGDHPSVGTFLQSLGYHKVWWTWNGFEEDEKRRGGVEVWAWAAS